MFLDQAVSDYLLHLELANRSPNTLRGAKRDLNLFREWVERRHNGMVTVAEVTEEDIRRFMLYQKERGLAPATRRRRLIVIRAFFSYLRKKAGLHSNPAEDIPLPSLERKLRRCLEPEEVERFVREALNPLVKAAALILYHTGLRAGEFCGIKFSDLDLTKRMVRVLGKGRKERIVPLNDSAALAFAWYITEVRPRINSEYVFVTSAGPLQPHYLGDLVRREARRLGFEGISCHSFRHSFATQLWRRHVDLLAISALLGHSSPQTTAIYAHIHPQVLVDAVAKLD